MRQYKNRANNQIKAKASLADLFHDDNCFAWAFPIGEGKYVYQNTNDMGLFDDIDDYTDEIPIVDTIRTGDKFGGKYQYIAILPNPGVGEAEFGESYNLEDLINKVRDDYGLPPIGGKKK